MNEENESGGSTEQQLRRNKRRKAQKRKRMEKIRRRKVLYNEMEKVVKQVLEIKKNTIIALADCHKEIQQIYVLDET